MRTEIDGRVANDNGNRWELCQNADGNRQQTIAEVGKGRWQIEAEIAAEGVGMLEKKRKKIPTPVGQG